MSVRVISASGSEVQDVRSPKSEHEPGCGWGLFFLTGRGIQSLNLWGFCNGLRFFFFGHSQDCFLLTCQEGQEAGVC